MKLLRALLGFLRSLFPSRDQSPSELEDENELWRSAFLKSENKPEYTWWEDFSR